MAVTSKGSKWEISESCYIIAAFIPMMNWMAILYVGLTTNVKRWIYWGVFYATPLILSICLLYFSGGHPGDFEAFERYCNLLQIMAIIQAFWIRKEYLIRLEAIREGKILTKDEVKAILEKNKSINSDKKVSAVKDSQENTKESMINEFTNAIEQSESLLTKDKEIPKTKDNPRNTKEIKINQVNNFKEKRDNILTKGRKEAINIIDINTASESELASLPGIGLILAKKAINHRETKGYFNSVDEFSKILSLKPHILERIKPLVIVNKFESEYKTDELSSKIGRIVDF
ncbi:ComEA family DNA-binding protein [Clostridium aciditolerans]|uniref:Helix-hairpin-helix domain-containing protein n=1 Tax=Clostridium aciditolerans TaxID=339861 RepID=A0A934I1U3_9CLOT|nr:helix-hairpin-helix domain-containing protein [Clostridium aciditolerans]MBI6874763.1 helix-hairpin-helix domain-containing protein [Clostridium aciditolerans]